MERLGTFEEKWGVEKDEEREKKYEAEVEVERRRNETGCIHKP